MRDYFLDGEQAPNSECLKLEINDDYKALLDANDLSSLVDFMILPRTNSFRDVPQRLTVRLDLEGGGVTKKVYLKRHWSDNKGRTFKPHHEAQSEALNISLLKEHGIPVPDFVAAGWGFLNQRSVAFVGMHEVPGIQGDHFIEAHRDDENWPLIKRSLLTSLASLARDFHSQGFNHRDFYLCHFFVNLIEDEVELNMIDLQRVQSRRFFRQRWLVKDLSQLCYSSMKLLSHSDRLRFFLLYSKKTSLDKDSKKFIRRILMKTARLIKRGEAGKDR